MRKKLLKKLGKGPSNMLKGYEGEKDFEYHPTKGFRYVKGFIPVSPIK